MPLGTVCENEEAHRLWFLSGLRRCIDKHIVSRAKSSGEYSRHFKKEEKTDNFPRLQLSLRRWAYGRQILH